MRLFRGARNDRKGRFWGIGFGFICYRMIIILIVGAINGLWSQEPEMAFNQAAVILSAESSLYREALRGFTEVFGIGPPIFNLAQGELALNNSVKAVVTFGSKAAYAGYPRNATLIYVLAPSVELGKRDHAGPKVKIFLVPAPDVWLGKVKEIQPLVKRLGILQSGWVFEDVVKLIKENGQRKGIEVINIQGFSKESFPELLRYWKGRVQAIWLPPDPELVTPATLATLEEFCRNNKVGLYVPSEALIEKGALANISPSYEEMGRLAGWAAREVVEGRYPGEKLFPQKTKVVINLKTARQMGLEISPSALESADRVVR